MVNSMNNLVKEKIELNRELENSFIALQRTGFSIPQIIALLKIIDSIIVANRLHEFSDRMNLYDNILENIFQKDYDRFKRDN